MLLLKKKKKRLEATAKKRNVKFCETNSNMPHVEEKKNACF